MIINNSNMYKLIPSVNKILAAVNYRGIPKRFILTCVKNSIKRTRFKLKKVYNKNLNKRNIFKLITNDIENKVYSFSKSKLKKIINGTGVVLHTNLGRSILTSELQGELGRVLSSYSNLEFDVKKGERQSRGRIVEDILCKMSGAEDAFVVNNNAGAVLLSLNTLSCNTEVIISRGELVEIGGSFRLPDIILKGNSLIREIGTTNCTYLKDYEEAIGRRTGLILKVHSSNYDISGYAKNVPSSELIKLSNKVDIPIVEDIGSGTFIDLSKYGLKKIKTIKDFVKGGVDIILLSGDKVLGGPQSGIILGKRKYINIIRKNPLARAVRIDKVSLFLLENTLQLYWDEAKVVNKIPTLRIILENVKNISIKSKILYNYLLEFIKKTKIDVNIKIFDVNSVVGGGALPSIKLKSKSLGIKIKNYSESKIEKFMRNYLVPIIGRIDNRYFLLDLRTISLDDLNVVKNAFKSLFRKIDEM